MIQAWLSSPAKTRKQRGATGGIEMRGDLVEQQERRRTAHRALQPGMREQDGDQQRLLLAGRGRLGGDALLGVNDAEIGAMRPERRRRRRAHRSPGWCASAVRKRSSAASAGIVVEPALDRADQREASAREGARGFRAQPRSSRSIASRRAAATATPSAAMISSSAESHAGSAGPAPGPPADPPTDDPPRNSRERSREACS